MSARFAKPIMSAICLALLLPASVFAQNNNNNPNGNNFFGSAVGGVKIDASGMLSEAKDQIDSSVRQRLQQALRSESLPGSAAEMRMVSLTRLEREAQLRWAEGLAPSEVMSNLAGIYQVEYLMVYPETGDIVLAGPAGDWKTNAEGRVVNAETERPVLQLDDLVVLLRAVRSVLWGRQDHLQDLGELFPGHVPKNKERMNKTQNRPFQ